MASNSEIIYWLLQLQFSVKLNAGAWQKNKQNNPSIDVARICLIYREKVIKMCIKIRFILIYEHFKLSWELEVIWETAFCIQKFTWLYWDAKLTKHDFTLFHGYILAMPSLVAQSDAHPTSDQVVMDLIPTGSGNILFGVWSWNIVILSLLLVQEEHLSVSGERLCTNTS